MNPRTAFLLLILGLSSLGASAQGLFGLKIGSNLYQPQNELASIFPRPGVEAMFTGKFQLSENNAHRVMVEFGYVLANAPSGITEEAFYSKYTGQPLSVQGGIITDANVLTHFASASVMYQFTPLSNDVLNVYIGPEFSRMLGYSFVIDYTLGPNPDDEIQEIFPGNMRYINRIWYYNIRYGIDLSIARGQRTDWKLYGNFIHQLDRRPYFPAGFSLGVKFYFGGAVASR